MNKYNPADNEHKLLTVTGVILNRWNPVISRLAVGIWSKTFWNIFDIGLCPHIPIILLSYFLETVQSVYGIFCILLYRFYSLESANDNNNCNNDDTWVSQISLFIILLATEVNSYNKLWLVTYLLCRSYTNIFNEFKSNRICTINYNL